MKQIVLVSIGSLAPCVGMLDSKVESRNCQWQFRVSPRFPWANRWHEAPKGRQGTSACRGRKWCFRERLANDATSESRKTWEFEEMQGGRQTRNKAAPALVGHGATLPGRAFPVSARSRRFAGREPRPRQCVFSTWTRTVIIAKRRARIISPSGLSASDEFYLWGLLALTFAQPQADANLFATPHYCLRQLGVIDQHARRGGTAVSAIRESDRTALASHLSERSLLRSDAGEHRKVSFGFLSYSLPLDPESSRAWRIAWDPIFFDIVRAAGGSFRFDLATYRELDPASRRLFLSAQQDSLARRATSPRFDLATPGGGCARLFLLDRDLRSQGEGVALRPPARRIGQSSRHQTKSDFSLKRIAASIR